MRTTYLQMTLLLTLDTQSRLSARLRRDSQGHECYYHSDGSQDVKKRMDDGSSQSHYRVAWRRRCRAVHNGEIEHGYLGETHLYLSSVLQRRHMYQEVFLRDPVLILYKSDITPGLINFLSAIRALPEFQKRTEAEIASE